MKNWLFTLGVGLISAGIGFIVGSKWTEKEVTRRLEDEYQAEYDLLAKRFKEREEEKIREDERKKCAEMSSEVEKMHESIRRHADERSVNEGIRKHAEKVRTRRDMTEEIDEVKDWDDEEELEEFGGKTEDDDIWEEVVDDYDPSSSKRNYYGHPKSLCEDADAQDEYEKLLYENDKRRDAGCDVYIISYDEYYNNECNDECLTYDPNNQMLIRDAEPMEEVDADELVSFEALQLIDEGFTDVVYVHNSNLNIDFVIEKLDLRS